MKEDIQFLPVEGVAVAITKEANALNEAIWNTYLINRNKKPLENVFVRSKGYGEQQGKKQETSVLRHHFPTIEQGAITLIEPIDPALFPLSNEYWVSYYIGRQIYDKKFIFPPESIIEENFIQIPELKIPGILHV